ncbi:hypothetical protein Taro_046934 [Colocasia esculenta]|uniref:SWIM-type domain-containing protein n=1 Tax=Colocasia esculenta TaxID=4460 RepID=A0A843X029_COLES|nr:hypothetical protein [Colocasia esculenta]
MVGVVLRLGMTSKGVRRGVSSRPQHPKVPRYSLHHHLWITTCSCKAWSRQCRLGLRRRRHYMLNCRHKLRLQLQFPRSMVMVVRPSRRACRQESEMDQYLEEQRASQKRSAPPFQRQDMKKAEVYQSPQHPVAGLFGCFYLLKMKDYDAILGLDWLEEHYALVDCRGKKITFRIPGEDEFSHSLPKNLAGRQEDDDNLVAAKFLS